MKKNICGIMLFSSAFAGLAQDYKNPELTAEQRAADLLERMTIEEKAEQLLLVAIQPGIIPENVGTAKFRPTLGGLLGGPNPSAAYHNTLQKAAVETSRLGIPILFGADIIHGARSIYPVGLGQAASFNPELVEQAAAIAARETRLLGYHWSFAPMVNLYHDPRWGRVVEGFGEDPLVNGLMGAATVRGFQGSSLSDPTSIAACLKHYAGYGFSRGGRDYSETDLSRQRLWDLAFPPFIPGLEAGAATVMSSFNDINGVPAVANEYILKDVLQKQLGFKGFVVSDWAAVQYLKRQGFAGTPERQTLTTLQAGNHMDMGDSVYTCIPEMVRSGQLDVALVDEAVRRILRIKFMLGLFENPYFEEREYKDAFLKKSDLEMMETLGRESVVLLQNKENILPLSASHRKVAVISSLLGNSGAMTGCWSGYRDKEAVITIRDGFTNYAPDGVEVKFIEGLNRTHENGFGQVQPLADWADVVVCLLGEDPSLNGENSAMSSLRFAGSQQKLLERVLAAGKPVVLVIVAGRPLDIEAALPTLDAVVFSAHPGTMGGKVLADVVFGAFNPSGKLPFTYPRNAGQVPLTYYERLRSRPGKAGNYLDLAEGPLFSFGYGLSYTQFSTTPIALSGDTISPDGRCAATVNVKNEGDRAGQETVFWFLTDEEASITRPHKRLIGFQKIALQPGESADVTQEIVPSRDLAYFDGNGNRILESGRFFLSNSAEPEMFGPAFMLSVEP
jgi:beta-glucosidase